MPSASRSSPAGRQAVVVVDGINPLYFPGAEALLPAAWTAAQALARLLQRLRRRKVLVVYANDNLGRWQSDFGALLAECQALPGLRGAIARTLAPAPDDLTVLKPRHSAFFATPLDLLLRDHRIDELIVAGLATDMCVHQTAVDAHMRGYRLWVPEDCSAAESPEAHRHALQQLQRMTGCSVRPATRAARRPAASAKAAATPPRRPSRRP